MPSVALNDIAHMREAVFFDGPDVKRKLSRADVQRLKDI